MLRSDSPDMSLILLIVFLVVVIAGLTVVLAVVRAPSGYEDGQGFHFGEAGDDPRDDPRDDDRPRPAVSHPDPGRRKALATE